MRWLMAILMVAACGAVPTLARAGSCAQVTVGGASNKFTPPSVDIPVGGCVTFTNAGGFHNAVSDSGAATAFRCANGCDGTGGDGTPASTAWTATVTFPTRASIGYHCEVHGVAMAGTVNVGTTPVELQSFDVEQGGARN